MSGWGEKLCEIASTHLFGQTPTFSQSTAATEVELCDRVEKPEKRQECAAGGSGAEQSVQSMHALHHGREIQCLTLLRAPAPHQAIAVITGGEEGALRSFLYHGSCSTGAVSLHTVL